MMAAALTTGQHAPAPDEVPAQRCSLGETDQLRAYARVLVAQAPPLTAEQRARVGALMRRPSSLPRAAAGVA